MRNFMTQIVLVIMFIIIVSSIGILTIGWRFIEEKPLNVTILDNTVPDKTFREHRGLIWLLNNQKYIKEDNSQYKMETDYFGFFPKENKEYDIKLLPKNIENSDMIYIADTYGVYEEEYYNIIREGNRTRKIYGGMTERDVQIIKKQIYENGTPLVVEFNAFGTPTTTKVQNEMEDILEVEWTGWIGRYFPDLIEEGEVPAWAVKNYEAQYNKEWEFEGSGFVFVDKNDYTIVLQEGIESGQNACQLSFTEAGSEKFDMNETIYYNYWFDIVEPRKDVLVAAEFHLDMKEEGEKRLSEAGIPTDFPAILVNKNKVYTSYYFSGDFCDVERIPVSFKLFNYDKVKKAILRNSKTSAETFFWEIYVPVMKVILNDVVEGQYEQRIEQTFTEMNDIKYNARLGNTRFEVYKNDQWEEILIKGVNLGMAKPGYYPGEAAITKDEYLRWIKMIGEMNANAIRVYTIHPPAFYEALYEYNKKADEPIYLFHGVWIDEESFFNSENVYDEVLMDDIRMEIERTIDLIHGNASFEIERGHAGGEYSYDVSEYVIGWIFGFEWEPDTVVNTNKNNKGMKDKTFKYLETKDANPFEIWLGELMEYVIEYEVDNYKWQRPISFTNWPTTDMLVHPSEPRAHEDKVTVHPNHVKARENLPVGVFASYHIYPNYPDFINFDEKYNAYIDANGIVNGYAGYLNDLRKEHDMPVLVAEYGVPSSRGIGRLNPQGMNQGRHTEKEQGEKNAYLFESMVIEDYAGGLLFSWQDEWFKKAWNISEFDNKEKRAYWMNMQTYEEQYGVLGFETELSQKIKIDGLYEGWNEDDILLSSGNNDSNIQKLYVRSDEKGVYLGIQYFDLPGTDIWNKMNTMILIDTIPNQGNKKISNINYSFDRGIDFLININGETDTAMKVDSHYDQNHYLYAFEYGLVPFKKYTKYKNNGIFHPITMTTRGKMYIPSLKKTYPFQKYETGKLSHGNGDYKAEDYYSLTDFNINYDTNFIEIRIPWMLMNFKDPSEKEILADFWIEGIEAGLNVNGISLAVLSYDVTKKSDRKIIEFLEPVEKTVENHIFKEYRWENWDEVKTFERLKESYYILQDVFSKIY